MQIFAIVVSIAIAVVGIALFVRAISQIIGVMKVGAPARDRNDHAGQRVVTMLKETLGHTRMVQWTWVGIGHWFVFIGFGLLFFTLVTAFGQLFDPYFAIPLIGHFFAFEWVTELFTLVMVVAIIAFIGYRATRPSERVRGADGRFFGSTMWQGYFVELVILGVGLCIGILRGLEYAIIQYGEHPDNASFFHFPIFGVLGEAFSGLSESTLANLIYLVAMIKIVISFTWMITISMIPTMGVAWHRFLAFFNIYFRREADGANALGAMRPMTSAGEVVDFADLEDMDEDTVLGVGAVEDFSWKGLLDFNTCTECGRCQSQCPAWNTEKPLSPKLMVLALRDHAYAKAPYLQAGGEGSEAATALLEKDEQLAREVERPLVGDTGDEWFYMPESGAAVIDDDVLWSCTSCGACVQQCPVDIEHVDHIMDMRRYQVLVESNFPAELNGLFKGLENKGNPWNMNPNARLEWAQGLDFDVKVVGGEGADDPESLDEVDWLFWVGCAGAYEDRAKKTTRAVAELLNIAGVDFAVLGNGETCNGDPARRAGNEFIFQGLATQNAEVLKETRAKKVVATCAHCFNTLKNEYSQFGVELEVVHHTQLLNRLVREKKLTPVSTQGASRSITYHDPCFLGRHNQVYSPPRELLQIIPGAEYKEMPRNSERSFCCGAGGARMWMEETIGERINRNRTKEAVETGADQIAVGCPFCRVMLSDGLVAEQQDGNAREEVEVLDVAQMLLASVKGEEPRKRTAAAVGAGAAAGAASSSVAAEPSAGDATQTEETVTDTEDVGPAAKASGGTSLFDTPAQEAPQETTPADATPATEGGSLFDLGSQSASPAAADAPASAEPEEAPAAEPQKDLGSGGSLFDVGGDAPAEPAAKAAPEPAPEAESVAEPAQDLGSGGSLFDIAAEEPPPAQKAAEPAGVEKAAEPEATAEPSQKAAEPTGSIPEDGSLFDIAAPEPAAAPAEKAEPAGKAESEVAAAPAEDEAATQAEPEEAPAATPEPEPRSGSAPSSVPEGGSLFDIKAAVQESGGKEAAEASGSAVTQPAQDAPADAGAEADAEAEAEADTEPEAEPEKSEGEPERKPGPASTGAAHEPRTDADISGSGSLFDL